MSSNESRRVEIFARVAGGTLSLRQAAELLEISDRQARRLYGRFQREGPESLKHRHAGQRSNRAKPLELREQVLEFVRAKRNDGRDGIGPTWAAAAFAGETGLRVNQETLRRWMLEAGLWTGSRRRRIGRSRIVRQTHFGELVVLRGEVCSWPGERRAVNWIVELVDAATGIITMQVNREPTWALSGALRAWLTRYGVPHAVHASCKPWGMRESRRHAGLTSTSPLTQLERMCASLSIPIITADALEVPSRTPETHWARLVDEFRARAITNDSDANLYLEREYVPCHNQRCAEPPAADDNFHRSADGGLDLDAVFRLEEEHPISADWKVQYRGRCFQVQRESAYPPVRDKVVVCEWPDRRLEIQYRGNAVKWQELPVAGSDAAATRWRTAQRLPVAVRSSWPHGISRAPESTRTFLSR